MICEGQDDRDRRDREKRIKARAQARKAQKDLVRSRDARAVKRFCALQRKKPVKVRRAALITDFGEIILN
jgi:hypothetical protein